MGQAGINEASESLKSLRKLESWLNQVWNISYLYYPNPFRFEVSSAGIHSQKHQRHGYFHPPQDCMAEDSVAPTITMEGPFSISEIHGGKGLFDPFATFSLLKGIATHSRKYQSIIHGYFNDFGWSAVSSSILGFLFKKKTGSLHCGIFKERETTSKNQFWLRKDRQQEANQKLKRKKPATWFEFMFKFTPFFLLSIFHSPESRGIHSKNFHVSTKAQCCTRIRSQGSLWSHEDWYKWSTGL